ncbi:ATP-binding cassette domain-containing protein [Mucilaginibacter roseus]|uniref:ATP-binding cassette domain-containing protein n=1 Tax=Mucilaginibacter roseus TaxID=1528868 RepID=A0ABS8U0Y4_9SPHI|nr:ATP-binding cassette domain-containing protein [Mucilaginibacter roseus]MCD8739178.1 ATP-binding cassette domain-containing protein [Mucilaginibacter roseus]
MIALNSVHKIFNKGKASAVTAINNLSLNINSGEFVIIIGANGSGKTTLLNLVAGSIYADEGTIQIGGNDVTRMADHQRSKWVARVFQNPLSGTAPDLSIIDNFRLAAIRTKHKRFSVGVNADFREKVKEHITTLGMGLENKLEQPMGTLSGGQRQALTLLMSVMDSCKVLLLDEPTAALDPRSAEVVMRTADKLIHDFNLTAILITHNLKDAFQYGTRLIQMNEGNTLRDISAEDKKALTQNDIFNWFS